MVHSYIRQVKAITAGTQICIYTIITKTNWFSNGFFAAIGLEINQTKH